MTSSPFPRPRRRRWKRGLRQSPWRQARADALLLMAVNSEHNRITICPCTRPMGWYHSEVAQAVRDLTQNLDPPFQRIVRSDGSDYWVRPVVRAIRGDEEFHEPCGYSASVLIVEPVDDSEVRKMLSDDDGDLAASNRDALQGNAQ